MTSERATEEAEEVPERPCVEDTVSKDSEPSTSSVVAVPEVVEVSSDVVIYEEETRMSAEPSSRAQTPAKQVGNVF